MKMTDLIAILYLCAAAFFFAHMTSGCSMSSYRTNSRETATPSLALCVFAACDFYFREPTPAMLERVAQ